MIATRSRLIELVGADAPARQRLVGADALCRQRFEVRIGRKPIVAAAALAVADNFERALVRSTIVAGGGTRQHEQAGVWPCFPAIAARGPGAYCCECFTSMIPCAVDSSPCVP